MNDLEFGAQQVNRHLLYKGPGSTPGGFTVTAPFGRTVIGIGFDQHTHTAGSAEVSFVVRSSAGKILAAKTIAMHTGQNVTLQLNDTPPGSYDIECSVDGPTAFAVSMSHTKPRPAPPKPGR